MEIEIKRELPGTTAVISDYNLNPADEVIKPGKIRLIMADLPDTVTVQDEADPMKTRKVRIQPFSPIVVYNVEKMIKYLQGTNILGEKNTEYLDVVNLLKLYVGKEEPVALVKIVKRNHNRPDPDNLHEMTEAFEYTIENLKNFPAGIILPVGVSAEDDFGETFVCRNYVINCNEPKLKETLKISDEYFVPSIPYQIEMVFSVEEKVDPVLGIVKRGKIDFGGSKIIENIKLLKVGNEYRVAEETEIIIKEKEIIAVLQQNGFFTKESAAGVIATQTVDLEVEIGENKRIRIENLIDPKKTASELFIKTNEGMYTPKKTESFDVLFDTKISDSGETKGIVLVNDEAVEVLENGVSLKEITLDSLKTLTTVEFLLAEGVTAKILSGTRFGELEIDGETKTNGYKINIVPENVEIVKMFGEYVNELTKNLNECIVYLGVKPPKNNTTPEIEKHVRKLEETIKFKKGFVKQISSTEKIDLGKQIVITAGSVKRNGIGGISNFPTERIRSISVNKKVITTEKISFKFNKGDVVEIYFYDKKEIKTFETTVRNVTIIDDYTEITLSKAISFENFGEEIYIQNINKKDNKGNYIAAMYAEKQDQIGKTRAMYGLNIDGESEVLYTDDQVKRLNNIKITVINREATGNKPEIKNAPTMARNESDYTKQETMQLMLYFMKEARRVSKADIGKRMNSTEDQVLFHSKIKDIFEAEVGKTIEAGFDLKISFKDYVKSNGKQLFIRFSIKEIGAIHDIVYIGKLK